MFIYLVLSAQFESFVAPVRDHAVGAAVDDRRAAALWLDRRHAQHLQPGRPRHAGRPDHQARHPDRRVHQPAARARARSWSTRSSTRPTLRLRPILMTTGAMVLGALPLALAHGAGAESRTQIGWVIVGGMSFGTLLTLFVVPTAYTLLVRGKMRDPRRRGSSRPPAPVAGAARRRTPTSRIAPRLAAPAGRAARPSARPISPAPPGANCNRIATPKRQARRFPRGCHFAIPRRNDHVPPRPAPRAPRCCPGRRRPRHDRRRPSPRSSGGIR